MPSVLTHKLSKTLYITSWVRYFKDNDDFNKTYHINIHSYTITFVCFLGAFTKFRKRPLISPCLSVRMEQLDSHWADFHEIWYLSICRTSGEKIRVSLNSGKNNGYLTWRPIYIFDHISLSSSYNETFFRQKLQTNSKHTFCVQQIFPWKSCRLWDDVEEVYWPGQGTDGNMANAHWVLDN